MKKERFGITCIIATTAGTADIERNSDHRCVTGNHDRSVMHFEWDESKNRRNRAKHGISFETARLVFDDPRAISLQDRYEEGEERWQTIGRIGPVVILLVAHTYHEWSSSEPVIRMISARKATATERRTYEQNDP